MKRTLLLLSAFALLSCLSLPVYSQIPNAGFESWTGGNPNNWWTNNIPTLWTPITQSGTAHSGSSSVRATVVTVATGSSMPPQIGAGADLGGFTWTQRSASLTGYYQFFPASGSGDRISILASLLKGGINGTIVAIGGGYVTAAASSWAQFSLPFTYNSPNVPDWSGLTVAIVGPGSASGHAGSYLLLDDLAYSGTASAVSDPAGLPQSFALEQNYPNPFNPSTSIRFSVAQPGHVSLKVYNVLGVEVASLVNEQRDAGSFMVKWNASGVPSGMYLYRLSVTSENGQLFDQSKKLVLMK